jgi:hypothetical protein
MRLFLRALFRLPLLALALGAAAASAQAQSPRLGVLIVVDQLSAYTFERRVSESVAGFRRLVNEGRRFRDCRYAAAPTFTSVGHATLVTGAYAWRHGIVANEWFDREKSRWVLSTEDPGFRTLGAPAGRREGTAPTALRVPTIGESAKLHDRSAKIVAIAGKDRAALLLGGRAADAAIWFEPERMQFTTSTFYGPQLPVFAQGVNAKIAEAVAKNVLAWGLPGGGVTGQHPMPASPNVLQAVDAWAVDLALAATNEWKLGADEIPDLLLLSFSSHDSVGHEFGAESPESALVFKSLDMQLGRLLQGLDAQVGKGRYVVVLTSDHGVAPVPEEAKKRGLDAGRFDLKALRERLEAELDTRLGAQNYFMNHQAYGLTVEPAQRQRVLAATDWLRSTALKQPGVFDLVAGDALDTPAWSVWRRGFFAGRSPDLLVITKPYWVWAADGTGHGSAWLYDRSVPLIFWGPSIARGTAVGAEPIDVAVTLADLLSLPPPAGAEGRVLSLSTRE